MAALGQTRKSVTATRVSALGGKAEVDFGRLDVCSMPIRLSPTPTICRVCRQTPGAGIRVEIDVLQRDVLPFPASLPEFQRLFPDDTGCAVNLEKARWGDGFVYPYGHEARDPFRFPKRSASPEISPRRPAPSFTRENGRTLDVVGVGDNRIGTVSTFACGSRIFESADYFEGILPQGHHLSP